MAKVTIKDVAKLAGVSIATVSRGINQPDTVTPETIKKVEDAIKCLDYRPNFFARRVKVRVPETIAFVYPTDKEHVVSNPFYSKIFEGVETEIQKHQFSLIFIGQRQHTHSKNYLVNLIKDRRVDGFIFVSLFEPGILKLISKEVAIVLIDSFNWYNKRNFILADNFHGAVEATDHLIRLGHRRILFLSGTYEGRLSWSFRERFRGFRERLENQGIDFEESMKYEVEIGRSASSIEDVMYDVISGLLNKEFPYSAIFAASDRIAIGAMKALREKGLEIPYQVSIVGFEGIEAAKQTEPPLTTVEIDGKQMGALGVKCTLDIIKSQKDKPYIMLVPAKLVIRDSTGPYKKKISITR